MAANQILRSVVLMLLFLDTDQDGVAPTPDAGGTTSIPCSRTTSNGFSDVKVSI